MHALIHNHAHKSEIIVISRSLRGEENFMTGMAPEFTAPHGQRDVIASVVRELKL